MSHEKHYGNLAAQIKLAAQPSGNVIDHESELTLGMMVNSLDNDSLNLLVRLAEQELAARSTSAVMEMDELDVAALDKLYLGESA